MPMMSIQVSRQAFQTATVHTNVGRKYQKTTDVQLDQARKTVQDHVVDGKYDHLFKTTRVFDVDATNSGLECRLSDEGTQTSLTVAALTSKHPNQAVRAIRVETLRNQYNSMADPEDADEHARSHADIACMITDVMHWCECFNVDFAKAMALAKSHFSAESESYKTR